MKNRNVVLLVLAICGLSVSAFARSWDSVAVYWRDVKTVVQINEGKANVWPGSRLHAMMDALGAELEMDFVNKAETVVIRCGRNANAATCTFRFVAGSGVMSEPRRIAAEVSLDELAQAGFRGTAADFAPIDFLNSNGDQFAVEIQDGFLKFRTSKR